MRRTSFYFIATLSILLSFPQLAFTYPSLEAASTLASKNSTKPFDIFKFLIKNSIAPKNGSDLTSVELKEPSKEILVLKQFPNQQGFAAIDKNLQLKVIDNEGNVLAETKPILLNKKIKKEDITIDILNSYITISKDGKWLAFSLDINAGKESLSGVVKIEETVFGNSPEANPFPLEYLKLNPKKIKTGQELEGYRDRDDDMQVQFTADNRFLVLYLNTVYDKRIVFYDIKNSESIKDVKKVLTRLPYIMTTNLAVKYLVINERRRYQDNGWNHNFYITNDGRFLFVAREGEDVIFRKPVLIVFELQDEAGEYLRKKNLKANFFVQSEVPFDNFLERNNDGYLYLFDEARDGKSSYKLPIKDLSLEEIENAIKNLEWVKSLPPHLFSENLVAYFYDRKDTVKIENFRKDFPVALPYVDYRKAEEELEEIMPDFRKVEKDIEAGKKAKFDEFHSSMLALKSESNEYRERIVGIIHRVMQEKEKKIGRFTEEEKKLNEVIELFENIVGSIERITDAGVAETDFEVLPMMIKRNKYSLQVINIGYPLIQQGVAEQLQREGVTKRPSQVALKSA